MTWIKTLGFSLNALPTRLQRLPRSYRIAGSGFLLAGLLGGLLTAGCVETRKGGPNQIEVEKNGVVYVLQEAEIDNLRFEPQGLPYQIQSAYAYWLRRGDTIAPLWDTHEWHWESKGSNCGFAENASTDDCQVCNWCNLPPNYGDSDGPPPCMGSHPFYGNWDLLQVVAYSGFIKDDNPQPIIPVGHLDHLAWRFSFFSNCSNRPVPFTQQLGDPLAFAPVASGLYSFWFGADGNAEPNEDGFKIISATNSLIKVHVVEPGLAQQVAYQLDDTFSEDERVNNQIMTHEYWTWTMDADQIWLENFSQNLRVTDIRIFRGTCVPDPTQGKQCAIPNESVPVRPSRILFLPDFRDTVLGHPSEASKRCYNNNPTTGDFNFINLGSCREECGASQMACTSTLIKQKSPTPTYDPADYSRAMSGMPEVLPKKLTWLVEFNTSEGADADLTTPGNNAMPAGAPLIIEFTIQARN